MRKSIFFAFSFFLFCLASFLIFPVSSRAHGIVGQRFFPATMAVEDPFAADEMNLLGYSNMRQRDGSLMQAFEMDIQKRLSRDIGLSLAAEYDQISQDPDNIYGFKNLETTLKYVMFKSPSHETILAAGLSLELGGTGTKGVPEADTASTLTPTFYFGKGFGDLPDSLKYARPFAITGTAGIGTPLVNSVDPVEVHSTLNYGMTVMYSTMYLQSFVKDIGIPKPFSRVIPIVEFSFATDLNGPTKGMTTAYANPGFLWVGKYMELGLEAIMPMNSDTETQSGFMVMVHLFLDDISPGIFSKTLSGEVLGPTQP